MVLNQAVPRSEPCTVGARTPTEAISDSVLDAASREFATLVARDLTRDVIPTNPNGFTFDPRGLYLPDFAPEVYIVSLDGYTWTGTTSPSQLTIALWVLCHIELLSRPCYYIGGWISLDEALFYLDISVPVRGKAAALRLATEQRQFAIYHPASCKEILVPQPIAVPERRVA